MLTLNLSTASNEFALALMLAEGDDDDTRTQGDDGDYGPFEVTAGDDKSKGDGGHDDSHNDIVARLEALYLGDDGPETVPQFTPIESLSAWIAWSKGCPPDCGCIYCS